MRSGLGFPLTEFLTFGSRYSLIADDITLDKDQFYTDPDGATGPLERVCDPLKAGQYLCDEVGNRFTSLVGYSTVYNNTNGIRPTRGHVVVLSQDLAGLDRRREVSAVPRRSDQISGVSAATGSSPFTARAAISTRGGKSPGPGRDAIRLNDRFFGPQLRGFDIRGIGPRVERVPYDLAGALTEDSVVSDALGGRAYYQARLELEFPLSASLRSMGLRPSAFVDAGSLWSLTKPVLVDVIATCTPVAANTDRQAVPDRSRRAGEQLRRRRPGPTASREHPASRNFTSATRPSPALSIGIGVNWTSPFGPLRIDLAKALLKEDGDDTKLFSFNVGTSF